MRLIAQSYLTDRKLMNSSVNLKGHATISMHTINSKIKQLYWLFCPKLNLTGLIPGQHSWILKFWLAVPWSISIFWKSQIICYLVWIVGLEFFVIGVLYVDRHTTDMRRHSRVIIDHCHGSFLCAELQKRLRQKLYHGWGKMNSINSKLLFRPEIANIL